MWNDTLIQCRGLVLDDKGRVVAKPFKKFFNIEENKHIPSDEFVIHDKLDGSLGILFCYEGEWIMASRGSFTSDQAVKAQEILDNTTGWKCVVNKNYTYLFEIIYKENRIVIDYGDDEKLVLLGLVSNLDGVEYTADCIKQDVFEIPYQYNYSNVECLKTQNYVNKEGFVVTYNNGQKVKVKLDWYLVRHKIVWNLTNKLVWEHLKEDTLQDLIDTIPDEFYDGIKDFIEELSDEYLELEETYYNIYKSLCHLERKAYAEEAKKYKYPALLFAMLDERSVDKVIWKIIKPERSVRLLTK